MGDELRSLLAELLGTFALTFVAAASLVIGEISGGEVTFAARAVAPGLVVMALIYAIGYISGAHFNPAVTLGFAARRAFPFRRVPGYWIAQIAGALLAALLLRALFSPAAHLGETLPKYGVARAFVMEIILTWLLVTVILGTATNYRLVGTNAAIAVGSTIALCGLFAAPISGASMNPARSLGPAVFANSLGDIWIYILGPFIGSAIAVVIIWVLGGPLRKEEIEVAGGKTEESSRR